MFGSSRSAAAISTPPLNFCYQRGDSLFPSTSYPRRNSSSRKYSLQQKASGLATCRGHLNSPSVLPLPFTLLVVSTLRSARLFFSFQPLILSTMLPPCAPWIIPPRESHRGPPPFSNLTPRPLETCVVYKWF